MNCLGQEWDERTKNSINKDTKSVFRLTKELKEIDDTTIKDVKGLFRIKKENETIENRIVRDIRNTFERGEEGHYKLVRVGNIWSNNYIKYESNDDRNKKFIS